MQPQSILHKFVVGPGGSTLLRPALSAVWKMLYRDPQRAVVTDTRIIKKYANRRLYDTESSKHVTLNRVRELIVAGVDIQIVEESTGADITRALLLQIIVDQEQSGGKPMLTEFMLAQLIRFHGNPMQGTMAEFLQRSVSTFVRQQRSLQFLIRR